MRINYTDIQHAIRLMPDIGNGQNVMKLSGIKISFHTIHHF